MSLSTVIVAFNSQTLRRYEPEGAKSLKAEPALKDPVCGMDVDPSTEHKTDYDGKTYYFCSAHCREAFESNPRKYAEK